ncbi:DEAD/DEAH box helicase [Bifidobacterium imperatoris]|uniref:Helicase n=2 Tax=Bifidobacterium imperatoris TaxID=2020965 RepID=A0A2N5IPB8_9BIFI|nr:type ISP restriction/modification enzyme [Bifidobacterium imperatoris]PLS23794.1 helicase [Bifidobacterium imperatoris]QSY58348.1 DEAD/DEAH box helicase [Bifidobacterium imperatoris]
MSIDEIFAKIVTESVDKREQGTRFERAVEFFLEHDPAWLERIKQVWMWDEAPTNDGKMDTGIDLVAEDVDGSLWAIQAKCYSKPKLAAGDVSTFFMNALADKRYQHYMIADTVAGYTSVLENFMLSHPDMDLVRLDMDTMRESNLDWQAFSNGSASNTNAGRVTYSPRPHQREAIEAVTTELKDHDRCSLVMACGTGKTLTSLRLTESMVGEGGTVLFLAPSISLVSQSMRDWVNQTRARRINVYVVCSDGKASKLSKSEQESYGQLTDIPFPATTNAETIANRFQPHKDALNVVFSTYQSIQVIHDAQQLGLPDFDLTICDEAHRTTGVMDGEAAFQKIHDADFIHSTKRLYMTATPRIFGEGAKNKAKEGAIEIASMDDEQVYGRIAYRLSFGKAVALGLLTDYKIVVMQVAESMMGSAMQKQYSAKDSEIPLDDAAKFVGCWKALFDRRHAKGVEELVNRGRHAAEVGPDDAKRVLHHAIAFAASIKDSKALSAQFRTVIDDYTRNLEDTDANKAVIAANHEVHVEIDHVDGGMDAATRRGKLDWLAAKTADNECHILSNARCLAEGIDVPDLDAVIYLNARRSRVDIIQSVGRVMRKAPGKEYGYIIIPVVIPLGADPDAILSSGAYETVWQVVRALRSHDERLDAIINAAALGDEDSLRRIIEVEVLDESKLRKRSSRRDKTTGNVASIGGEGVYGNDGADDTGDDADGKPAGKNFQPELDFELGEMAKAINAQIVRKCGTKIYWGEWTDDIAAITRRRAEAIYQLVDQPGAARESFLEFVDGLKDSLNPGYSETDAIAVLAQHEVTKPIFQTLFTNKEVIEHNPIVRGLDRTMNALYAAGLPEVTSNPTLRDLYSSVRLSASQLETDVAKQNLIKEIYNEFFTKAFKDTADSLGIVYTPVEVVDAQLHMVQRALQREFGQSLGSRGVHVLDGFAGTGTYICRLIEDESLIDTADLPYKYAHDLHSNEIVPLAATIMDINIEQSYHKRVGGDYMPFPGALLTDTFQMHEDGDTLDDTIFTENTERIKQQKALPIKVIIGNPPYRAGDVGHTGTDTQKYPTLDKRIEETYVANSDANNNNSLYDHYIRAFRWASDRIGESGIVCFVSNGGWVKGGSGAGIRRCFTEEFNAIYVYNLRGNARGSGEERRKEKDNVFGSGTRTTIAITMLVKNPTSKEHGAIHYRDIGDYLDRQQKLNILKEVVESTPKWSELQPDKHGDWLDHRDDSYATFIPTGVQDGSKKLPTGLFAIWSRGLATCRDTWAWNMSLPELQSNMSRLLDDTNHAIEQHHVDGTPLEQDTTRFSWTRRLQDYADKGTKIPYDPDHCILGVYRPFCKQWVYFDSFMNERTYQQPRIFPIAGGDRPKGPTSSHVSTQGCEPENAPNEMTYQQSFPRCLKNMVIISSVTNKRNYTCFISDILPDLHVDPDATQCFPLYRYEKVEPSDDGGLFSEADMQGADEHGYIRHDAITDTGLKVFREAYPNLKITKEDIFYYVYGVLHSPEYRKRFANNLKKELPRIPLAKDFTAFMKAGRALAHLHLDYESIDPWPVMEVGDSANPGRTEKMTYPKKIKNAETGKKVPDLTVLKVAENLTIEGIPLRAYEYVVNGKSAIGWLIDRYKVTTDKKSGITNDPNDYSDNPRYIVDLAERVIRVSMETLDIVEGLPALEELPHPANWPAEWNNS